MSVDSELKAAKDHYCQAVTLLRDMAADRPLDYLYGVQGMEKYFSAVGKAFLRLEYANRAKSQHEKRLERLHTLLDNAADLDVADRPKAEKEAAANGVLRRWLGWGARR